MAIFMRRMGICLGRDLTRQIRSPSTCRAISSRIYFSTRDEKNWSSVGFIEIDINRPGRILRVADQPVLAPGDLAMFDDSGTSIGCIVKAGDKRYLYYMGWHLTVSVPWQNAIGLAISEEPNGPFVRHSRFPTISLDETDPYTISYPWVSVENGKFRMWYGSNIAWGPVKEDMRHLIKYAELDDGIHWARHNQIAINFSGPEEYAICKPCVVKDQDCYRMWFCARGKAYRIYYAESDDGISWRRHAEPDLSVSPTGWDSGDGRVSLRLRSQRGTVHALRRRCVWPNRIRFGRQQSIRA